MYNVDEHLLIMGLGRLDFLICKDDWFLISSKHWIGIRKLPSFTVKNHKNLMNEHFLEQHLYSQTGPRTNLTKLDLLFFFYKKSFKNTHFFKALLKYFFYYNNIFLKIFIFFIFLESLSSLVDHFESGKTLYHIHSGWIIYVDFFFLFF